jgi:ATP-binding cassette subfamily B protein
MKNEYTVLMFLNDIISLLKRRPWHFAGGLICCFSLDAIEMIPSLIIKRVLDEIGLNQLSFSITQYCLTIIICYLCMSLLRMGWRFMFIIPSRKLEAELKNEVFQKIMTRQYSEIKKLKPGDIISLMSQDISNIRMLMGPGILVFFDSLAYLVLIPSTLFYLLGINALYILSPFVLLIIFIIFTHKKFDHYYTSQSEDQSKISQFIYEDSAGIKIFRSFFLLPWRKNKYYQLTQGLKNHTIQIAKLDLSLELCLQIIAFSSLFISLYLSYFEVQNGLIAIGQVAITLQLIDKLMWPILSINYLVTLYQGAFTGFKRLQKITTLSLKEDWGENSLNEFKSLKIQSLFFSKDKKIILDNINLEILKNQKIALIGDIGSGKSTILEIIAGLYEKHEIQGKFMINDLDYSSYSRKSWNESLNYIPQNAELFSGPFSRNINLHNWDNELYLATQRSELDHDIKQWPEGLSTWIGEKGINLSGGQKQRTLMGRGFFHQSMLYIWDDAISGLDELTTQNIIESLKDHTIIMATHRLSALKNFNKIYLLRDGRIIDQGTFDELRLQSSIFKEMWIAQENLETLL